MKEIEISENERLLLERLLLSELSSLSHKAIGSGFYSEVLIDSRETCKQLLEKLEELE